MLVLGIDPGAQGALCLLDTSRKFCEFFDTPNTKNMYESLCDLDSWLISTRGAQHIAIEDVHSLGGMSAKSNFQFGRNLGLLEGVVHLEHPIVEYVQPKVWQKATGISFPRGSTPKDRKHITAARVLELYPEAAIYGPKGGLKDGRADALMIAHYLGLKYEGG